MVVATVIAWAALYYTATLPLLRHYSATMPRTYHTTSCCSAAMVCRYGVLWLQYAVYYTHCCTHGCCGCPYLPMQETCHIVGMVFAIATYAKWYRYRISHYRIPHMATPVNRLLNKYIGMIWHDLCIHKSPAFRLA